MGLIKEPLDVNFTVDPRPLTENEKKTISDYIKADKEKRRKKKHLTTAKSRTLSSTI
ncbi:MAG: hypothetical protein ACK5LR_05480 [Mangrovibacterium sp.]